MILISAKHPGAQTSQLQDPSILYTFEGLVCRTQAIPSIVQSAPHSRADRGGTSRDGLPRATHTAGRRGPSRRGSSWIEEPSLDRGRGPEGIDSQRPTELLRRWGSSLITLGRVFEQEYSGSFCRSPIMIVVVVVVVAVVKVVVFNT